MLLENKNAVIYGGSGRVGGAIARAFGREGARLFLVGREGAKLERTAEEIRASGATVQTAELDVLDEDAVNAHADEVASRGGGIDVSMMAIGHGDVHGLPLLSMPFDDFWRPIATAVRAQFLTTRAVARHMVERGSGVVMAITATTARLSVQHVGGTGVTFDAIESQSRQWAAELGPLGIRVVWLQTTGLPEAIADIPLFPDYGTRSGEGLTREELIGWLEGQTMLRRLTSLADVGNAAAFLASDHAAAVTATGINLTNGAVPGH